MHEGLYHLSVYIKMLSRILCYKRYKRICICVFKTGVAALFS